MKALITGASSGIGYELAKVMAEHGHDLVLVARDIARLDEVKKELADAHDISVRAITADLSVAGSAEKLYQECSAENIDILVNNAGVGLKGNFFESDLARQQAMVQLNVTTLMDLSYYFGRVFVARGSGKILNIASITAFFPGPKQPVYFATKSFVRSFSRALAYNLRSRGVTVTVLHPGVTKTGFFNAADASDFNLRGAASPRSVAECGYNAMMRGQIEVTHGFMNKILTSVFARITPYALQPIIIDKVSDA